MARSSTLVKPVDARMLQATVLRSERVTPSMVRVTVGGPEVAELTPLGFDQWFRMFVPRPGQDDVRLPRDMTLRGYVQYLRMSPGTRPLMRNYTFRAVRPGEVDIDLVVHETHDDTAFSAARWSQDCAVGSPLGFLDEGIMYAPPGGHDWTLLVADESGLPAVAGVLGSLPRDARGLAIVEVPTPEDVQDVDAPDGVEVRWVARRDVDPHGVPGRPALEALTATTLPAGRPYAFAVGEAGLATGARRYLVGERGVAKADVAFCGYWKHGARPGR